MTTATHQWLATAFIPGYIIDDVMGDAREQQVIQDGLQSSWGDIEEPTPSLPSIDVDIKNETPTIDTKPNEEEIEMDKPEEVKPSQEEIFFEKFWEVDKEKLKNYMSSKNIESYEDLLIESDGKGFIIKEKELPKVELTLKNLSLEKGAALSTNVSAYIVEELSEEVRNNIIINLKDVNTAQPGEYQYTVTYNNKLYTGKIWIYEKQTKRHSLFGMQGG